MNLLETLKSSLPVYQCVLPISKKQINFNPYKVKDQKHLMVIQNEESNMLKVTALVNILKNCSDVADPQKLFLADAEYLFLQIRSKSVEEIIKVVYNEDEAKHDISISINDIKCSVPKLQTDIKINSELSFRIRTPIVADYLQENSNEPEKFCARLVESVTLKGELYETDKYMPEDLQKVIDELPLVVYQNMKKFLSETPYLYYDFEINGKPKRMRGLLHFFRLP